MTETDQQGGGLNFEKDTGMDPCPNCSETLESAQNRVVARCPNCEFKSILASPVGWAQFAASRVRGGLRV